MLAANGTPVIGAACAIDAPNLNVAVAPGSDWPSFPAGRAANVYDVSALGVAGPLEVRCSVDEGRVLGTLPVTVE